ncbi:hypothetical protein I6F48_03645 [Pseudoalteromonas sp. SWYJ118]|uniref:hypothetical protein n=1 Tax=Pseudoalteromonas sp. SWYJ118 TaxID=2792062 RepID=UPI0018CDB57A|nr:hypothetical protein [Pseudoalteromonas sp. SWYJ118]MBH0074656.1 hypothetical protein [Pseudoalteromonas sp. SWYJ118]
MLKKLDKYMDNLKSPYWEVYFLIIVIAIGIAGTAVIFIDPMGLASKLGNAGSFLGGLFTIAAVVIAIITFKKMQSENKERLKFDTINQLEIEIIPNIVNTMIDNLIFIKDKIYQLKTLKVELNADEEQEILNRHENLKNLINQYEIKLKYLERNIGTNIDKIIWESDFTNFINSFNYLLEKLSSEPIEVEGELINVRYEFIKSIRNHIYQEYIKSSIHLEKRNFVYKSKLKFLYDITSRKSKVIAYLHTL